MRAQQRWTAAWHRRPSNGRRVRLLIEGPETAWFGAFADYRALGYEVAVCTGPGPDGGCCTLLTEGRCGLADDADVVVSALDTTTGAARRLTELLATRSPERPLILQSPHPPDRPVAAPGLRSPSPHDAVAQRVAAIRALTSRG